MVGASPNPRSRDHDFGTFIAGLEKLGDIKGLFYLFEFIAHILPVYHSLYHSFRHSPETNPSIKTNASSSLTVPKTPEFLAAPSRAPLLHFARLEYALSSELQNLHLVCDAMDIGRRLERLEQKRR